jgi:MarR family transcriptional regulator, lower aerobic nicotinate degradation pathway regulator
MSELEADSQNHCSPLIFTQMPGHLLRRCHQISVGIFLHKCGQYELTPLQYVVLSALDSLGPSDQVSLGGVVALDRTTITHVITKLLDRSLISRKVSSKDKRFKIVKVTTNGQRLLRSVQTSVEAVQTQLLEPLTAEEAATLIQLLAKVSSANNDFSRAPQK